MTTDGLSRRHALTAAAGVGLGLPLLAACNGTSTDTASDPAGQPGAGSGSSGGDGGAFARTSDIPEGGGTLFADQRVVVTQPTAGEFKGFSSTCTHQGCTVGQVAGGTINCPCHGSRFSITDGSVQQGPATAPLPEVKLDVQGTKISKA